MLALAIKARIPVIRVTTSDLLNVQEVLEAIVGDELTVCRHSTGIPAKADVVYAINEYEVTGHTYDTYVETGKVLVLVNQGEECPFAFDAGPLPVPRELMIDLLEAVVPVKKVEALLPSFNGLTLKAAAEIIKLVTARDKSLTPRGVMDMRNTLTGRTQGLAQVDTTQGLYLCPPELEEWVTLNKKYFTDAKVDARLVPRGVLLIGEPGVGKSQGGKYIANQFDVPMYRLDLAGALGKYVGESEQGFARVLSALDQEAPAVVMLDEIEKVFKDNSDSGITSRLLAQLLWWAQEHTSRVLLVLTTNDVTAIPPELYRAGRIDISLEIHPLVKHAGMALAQEVLDQFFANSKDKKKYAAEMVKEIQLLYSKKDTALSHATVVQCVYDTIKKKSWL